MTHTHDDLNEHCIDCGSHALNASEACLPGDLRRAKEENYKLRQALRQIYFYLTDYEISWGMACDASKAVCTKWMGTP